jgi:transcriptional antiterminator RfaH
MERWHAVYTQPHREALAREHLERQGFEVYAPCYIKRRRHARKVDDVPAPLFPRYIFTRFDPDVAGWRVIRSTRGCIDLVRSGLEPLEVPAEIIDEIRSRADENGYVVLARNDHLVAGAKVRIESGPFAEYEAIFETVRDEDRVVVLLSLLGGQVKAEVPIEAVNPLG